MTTIDEPSARKRFGALVLLQILAVIAALWVQFGDLLPWLQQLGARVRLSGFDFALILLGVLAATSCLAVTGMMRSGFRERQPEIAGFAIFFGFLLAFGQVILLAITIRTIDYEKQIAVKADTELQRSVATDADKRSMTLTGDIGAGLYDELARFDDKVGGIRTFVIDSHGGLVEEALRIGNFLAAEGVTVIARNNCDSACLIIAVASSNAYADADMQFGFHSVSSILGSDSDLGEIDRLQAQEQMNAFLIDHGVPRWVVIDSARVPASELIYYRAPDLLSWGVLAGTMSGNAVVATRPTGDQ